VLPFLQVAMILLSIGLIVLILLQAKGSSLGGIFGGDSSVYKSKRGVEKTLFNATVATVIVFFALAFFIVISR
jgi:preprotein translocase subunit SecG